MNDRKGRLVALAVAVFASPGCNGTFDLPDREPAIEGRIVSVGEASPAPGGSGIRLTIHVKEEPTGGDPCGIIFRVDDGTTLALRSPGQPPVPASIDQLTIGARVHVWADGGIAESCPAQAATEAIEVREETPAG